MNSFDSKAASSSAIQCKSNAAPFFQPEESREAFFGSWQRSEPFFKAAPPAGNAPKPATIQAKLSIGAPNDVYEQEAGAMADKVVQKLAAGESRQSVHGQVQRKCATCAAEKIQRMGGEEEKEPGLQAKIIQRMGGSKEEELQEKRIQRMGDKEDEPQVQTKPDVPSLQASPDLESRLNATKGSGSPLPDNARTAMESSFGADFSGVRVHTNSGAVQMNQELGAQAFTHGSDIYFNSGKYDTQSSGGQRLLAHELTHTVQQGGKAIQRQVLRPVPAIQMVPLSNYSNPATIAHDPSNLSDAQITATDEYAALIAAYVRVPYIYTNQHALLATRLALRHIRAGGTFSVAANGLDFISRAHSQLGAMAGVRGLENTLNWVPFNSPAAATNPSSLQSQFAQWLLVVGTGAPSGPSAQMNCWEVILYGAYRAGFVSESQLRALYSAAVVRVRAGAISSVGQHFESATQAGATPQVFDPTVPNSPSPLAGDIVVFNSAPVHATISTGNIVRSPAGANEHEIISLWFRNSGHTERTTIEQLMLQTAERPVRFWAPNWRSL